MGQGVASIGASLFGGMPATGAIARTSVNVCAGARSRLAAVIHALVLLAVVYAASGPVGVIPLAALAGVLFVTAVRMVQVATVRTIIGSTRADAITFTLTALITVSVDLVVAVLIGIVLAAFFALRSISAPAGSCSSRSGPPSPRRGTRRSWPPASPGSCSSPRPSGSSTR